MQNEPAPEIFRGRFSSVSESVTFLVERQERGVALHHQVRPLRAVVLRLQVRQGHQVRPLRAAVLHLPVRREPGLRPGLLA